MTTFFSGFNELNPVSLIPRIHGGEDHGGPAAFIETLLDALSRLSESSWTLMPGVTAMSDNLHPLFVHLPIAFLLAFAVAELLGILLQKERLRQFASGLLGLGAITAVGTVISGLIAADAVPHGAEVHTLLQWHQRAGITVMTLASGLAVWREWGGIPVSPMGVALNLIITGVMSIIIILGADLGGLMVYQHGVGVQTLQQPADYQDHSHQDMR